MTSAAPSSPRTVRPLRFVLFAVAVAGLVSLATASNASATDAILGWLTWAVGTVLTAVVLTLIARLASRRPIAGLLIGALLISAIAWFPISASWSDGCNFHEGSIPLWSAAAPNDVASSSMMLSYFDQSTAKECEAATDAK